MKKSIFPLLVVVLLIVVPFLVQKGTDFGGADGIANETIMKIQPDYQPWFENIWEPPGTETESLLFALQAAIGAGFIGYFIGYMRHKKKSESSSTDKNEKKSHAAH